jgi:two-component system sensor kinase FixL
MPLAAQPQYQAIFDNALEAIAVIDMDGTIVSANRAVEQIFGYAPRDVVGRNVGMLLPEPAQSGRHAPHPSYDPEGLRAIAGVGREVEGRRKDGGVFPLDLSIAEWQRDGETFFTGVMRDISARKDAEAALVAQEAQYRAIFDSAVEAMAVIDAQGTIQSINPSVERTFGYSSAELLGRNITLLMPESVGSQHDSYLARYRETGKRAIIGIGREVEGRRKDGSVFPLDLSVAEWERGGATYFTGIMRDVSRRRDAEAALADGKLQLANLYRQSGAGLAETDAAGRFVLVNDRYCEIVGRSREELLRLRLHDIAHPEDHQQNLPLFTRLVTAGGPHSIEERYVRGDGSIVWVTKTASPIRIEDGKPIGLLVAIDVTERRLAEAALRESEEQLRLLQNEFAHLARVNDLGEMAAAIAHEINQPLTAIVNFLHAGAMSVANESPAEALAAARKAMALASEQGLRAGAIVRGLREFVTKGDGGRLPEQADALVEAAMALALLDIRGTGIRLGHKPAGDVMVEVDRVQIQQVLVNLLRNAVDALVTNPPGAPRHLDIVVRDLAEEGVVEFCVADTGPGIPPEICDRLFEPFVTSKPKGMGMGLSVCRRIIQAHNGTIEVDCGDGMGATFRILLPRRK